MSKQTQTTNINKHRGEKDRLAAEEKKKKEEAARKEKEEQEAKVILFSVFVSHSFMFFRQINK